MSFTLDQILKNKPPFIYSVASNTTVQNAAILMAQKGIGALLVIDSKQLVGIFTERDIVNKLFINNLNPCETPISELMTRNLIFGQPNTTLAEAMATFSQYRFRHLPVLDDNQLVGIISSGDVNKWLLMQQQSELTYLSEYIRGEAHY